MIKKTIILILIILLGIILINIRSIFNISENVYIVFNVEEDLYKPYDWSKYKDIFPKDFKPKNSYLNIEELSKLDFKQKQIYDSIKTIDFHYPKKIIKSENNRYSYYISVSDLINVKLELEKEKIIDSNEIRTLNIISIDSLIELIPELYHNNLKLKNKQVKYHLIELSSKNSIIKCIDFNPIVIEYN